MNIKVNLMAPALIIHGHFYQPPRENPWTDEVEREAGAAPFHDWNERIYSECYRANAYARIVDQYNRVESIVNNYALMSFNFGPTLLSWMERHHPKTYARIIDADRESAEMRGGHGNAIAQGYNHAILPLCTERDRRTQIRWGIEDFRHRFGREPESLWLPETGCNDETLGALIDEGLKFVILSPHQAERVRPTGEDEWLDVKEGSVDTGVPYLYFHRDGSGRSIAIFFYDGNLARAIAFEGALSSSQALVNRFVRASHEGRVINVATDGESYGHHFHWGDRCIAYTLETEAPARGFRVTNYGEFLAENPPNYEVEIKVGPDGKGTAWSCAHGLGRWCRDCGCSTGACEGWKQTWREPLRRALDFLRDEAVRAFEATRGDLFIDPWAARDDYIHLVVDRNRSREEFLHRHAGRALNEDEKVRALTFLELQRNSMLTYTSCGWFFADISGIETVQDLKYAGRVLDFMDELHLDAPRDRFLALLSKAESNLSEMGDGAEIFRRFVEPCSVGAQTVASNIAISSLIDDSGDEGELSGFVYSREDFRAEEHGRLKLATGRLKMETAQTGKAYDYAFAAMHFGDVDFYCAMREFPGTQQFRKSAETIWNNFYTSSLPVMLRLAQENFGEFEYGLESVLPEGRERISKTIYGDLVEAFADEYASLYRANRRKIEMLNRAGFKLPTELRTAAEFTLGKQFEEEIQKQQESNDPAAYENALEIANEATRHGFRLDSAASRQTFEKMIADAVHEAVTEPTARNVNSALALIALTRQLGIEVNLERSQEEIYDALQNRKLSLIEVGELARQVGLAPRLIVNAPFKPERTQTEEARA